MFGRVANTQNQIHFVFCEANVVILDSRPEPGASNERCALFPGLHAKLPSTERCSPNVKLARKQPRPWHLCSRDIKTIYEHWAYICALPPRQLSRGGFAVRGSETYKNIIPPLLRKAKSSTILQKILLFPKFPTTLPPRFPTPSAALSAALASAALPVNHVPPSQLDTPPPCV
jgi:hypothetical protein